ncbi:MAG: ribosome rescue protein RqcH [Candidatus Thermoplasmatota archaeon]|nr:ribosome rescue protein RqcH [Candidatus Thermoplasmatota archaeon]
MLKKSLSSLAVRRFIREVKPLEGAYFQKAYQIDYDTLVLRFAIRREQLKEKQIENSLVEELLEEKGDVVEKEGISLGEGGGNYVRFDLYFKMGGFLFITSKVEREMPMQPSSFVMKLRKSLSNRILKSIDQIKMDRLVVLTFNPHQDDEGDWKLYLELFGDGNVILVKGNRIEAPFTSRSWATRTIKRGEEFSPPPSGIDPFDLTRDGLGQMISETGEDLVRFLIKRCSLPPPYAEEVCARGGFDKKMDPGQLDEEGRRELFTRVWEVLNEVKFGEKIFIHFLDDQPTLIEPVILSRIFNASSIDDARRDLSKDRTGGKGNYFSEMGSLNQALEMYMFEEGNVEEIKTVSRKEKRVEKLKHLLKTQEIALKKRREETDSFKEIADALYSDYMRIDNLLRNFSRKRYEIEPENFPEIVELQNGPGGSVSIRVKVKSESGERTVSLDPMIDINQNADLLYSRSKTARRKVEGIEKAILETKKKVNAASKEKEKAEDDASRPRSLRRFWFEAYRWCFTSESVLLIGGRDAKTNERVVKKYLRDSDLYAHADLSGAASVIVRVDKDQEANETTKVQACHFSILHSKAWNANIGSAGAYWVLPDQVSRTAQAGEFVAKGSFIIRGKKNLVEKLPLRGAVGTIYVEGVPKVMFGPEDAVKEICAGTYFRVIPGRTKKSDITKIIAKELGGELDQVMSVLPAGNMDISRVERE